MLSCDADWAALTGLSTLHLQARCYAQDLATRIACRHGHGCLRALRRYTATTPLPYLRCIRFRAGWWALGRSVHQAARGMQRRASP